MASERSGGNKGRGDRSALSNPNADPKWQVKGRRSEQRSPSDHERVVVDRSGRLASAGPVSRPKKPKAKFITAVKRASAEAALKVEVLQLRRRVERLEAQVQSLLPISPSPVPPPTTAAVDAPYAWIEQHLELMRNHPDCFVAIDPVLGDNGLVVHEADEAAFSRQLLALYNADPTARERLLLTHTSAY